MEGGREVDRFHRDFQGRLEKVETEYASFACQLKIVQHNVHIHMSETFPEYCNILSIHMI